jgi:hypothetical protein
MKNFTCYFGGFLLLCQTLSYGQIPQSNNAGTVPAQNNLNALPALDSIVTMDAVESDKLKEKNYQEEYQKQVELFQEKKSEVRQNTFSRSANQAQEMELEQFYHNANAIIPSDPTNGVLFYELGNYNTNRSYLLANMLKVHPNNATALELWAANAVVKGDSLTLIMTLQQLDSLGSYPKEMQCYAQDLIASTPDNSVLVTHGRWDSFGALDQQIKSNKPQITVVSLEFLQSPQYRALLAAKGLIIPPQKIVDVAYLGELVQLNSSKQFAFSMTIPSAYLQQFEEQMVPLGLVFLYPNNLNEKAILAKNEQLLNSLNFMECDEIEIREMEELKNNYLPMIETVENVSTSKNKSQKQQLEQKKTWVKKRKNPKK